MKTLLLFLKRDFEVRMRKSNANHAKLVNLPGWEIMGEWRPPCLPEALVQVPPSTPSPWLLQSQQQCSACVLSL